MKIENSVFTKTKLMLRQKNKNKKQTLTISILNHLWSCSFKRKCFCDDRNTLNTDHQDCWHSQYWSCLAAPLPLTLLGLPPVHCQGHCSPSYQKKKKKKTDKEQNSQSKQNGYCYNKEKGSSWKTVNIKFSFSRRFCQKQLASSTFVTTSTVKTNFFLFNTNN